MKRLKLHHQILIAMALGLAVGLPLNKLGADGTVDPAIVAQVAATGRAVGGLFLRLLQMLVVPLIVASLITGVTGLGDVKKLGRLGGRTLLFYLSTSAIAIATGVLMVNLVRPGEGVSLADLEAGATAHSAVDAPEGVGAVLFAQLEGMIPTNPLRAAADGKMLALIFFTLLFAYFLTRAEHDEGASDAAKANAATVRRFFEGLFDIMMRMTLAVIALAPIGVLGFVVFAAAGAGVAAFEALGWYALTVFLALLAHAVITLPLVIRFFAKRSPRAFVSAMSPALLTAFSTASSNGTLPLTMQCIEERAGVDHSVSSFVLPLGATVNMDGTALYEAVAVLFLAEVYGLDLTLGAQVGVAVTALLVSVGAAGIPHAGAVMMVVVLGAVGLPAEAVGLLLAVDRLLDMCRTTVNVFSDSVAAATIAATVSSETESDPVAPA